MPDRHAAQPGHGGMRLLLSRIVAGSYLLSVLVFGFLIRSFDWSRIESALARGPACPLRAWTGLRCAFCGMTHSWIAVAKGDWARAFAENALGPLLLLATVALASVMLLRRKRPMPWPRETALAVLAVLGAYAILRNFG